MARIFGSFDNYVTMRLLHGVYPERKMRFFASLRMTLSEGFAMTHGECQLIYVVHYSNGKCKVKMVDFQHRRVANQVDHIFWLFDILVLLCRPNYFLFGGGPS